MGLVGESGSGDGVEGGGRRFSCPDYGRREGVVVTVGSGGVEGAFSNVETGVW